MDRSIETMVELKFEKFLGKGSFGSVALFKTTDGKTLEVAVKTTDDRTAKSLYNEIHIMSKFKGCSRIVQCYGDNVQQIWNNEGYMEYNIIMEYASEGNLKNFMNRFKDRKLPEPMIWKFIRMLLEGLVMIHGLGYVHCDLKPENILIFPEFGGSCYELKICDFGVSKRIGDSKWWKPSRPFAGTPIYMSPDSILYGETSTGLDFWSLGCVVLEMCTGKKPWWHKNYDLKDLIDKGYEKPLIPSDLPSDIKLFVMTCFEFKPDEKKDALTLLKQFLLPKELTKLEVMNVVEMEDFDKRMDKIWQKIEEITSMSVSVEFEAYYESIKSF